MSPRNLLLLVAACLCTACIGPVFGDDCNAHGDLEETIATDGVRRVSIEAGAGSLRVTGLAGATQVVARGKVCAGSEARAGDISLDVSRRGDTIEVVVEVPESRGWSWRDHASVDLTVTLPPSLAVLITDGSGDLEVRGVESLELEDGSGNIDISDIAGDVTIEDGSGDLEVRGVGGTVRLDDGSGNIEVAEAGAVIVKEDGSGDIRFEDVRGNVRIERDGSGNIRVRGVGGDLVVERDGSGDIDVAEVAGRVSTPDD